MADHSNERTSTGPPGGGGERPDRTNTGVSVPAGIDLAYETAVSKLDKQLRSIDQFDAKVAPLVALLGLATAGYVAAARDYAERIVGGTALAAAIVAVIIAYFIRDYGDAPRADTFAAYAGYTSHEMKTLFLEAILAAISDNRRVLRQKAVALKVGLILLGAGSLVVIIVVAAGLDSRVR